MDIQLESTLHIVLRLRGGMYHFTSGRNDFGDIPNNGTLAIRTLFNLSSSRDVSKSTI